MSCFLPVNAEVRQGRFLTLSLFNVCMYGVCVASARRGWTSLGLLLEAWFAMATNRSLADLRKLQRNQLKSINKDELIDVILSSKGSDMEAITRLEDRLLSVANELAGLKQVITNSETAVDKKLQEMQQKVDRQAEIIMKQQQFLEQIDRKERETNIVVLGVPDEEEALEGATCDDDKLHKIWQVIGANTTIRSHRRLGKRESGSVRQRPILVMVNCKDDRDNTLAKASELKRRGAPYDKVFIKKDVHPAVRREWKRLRDVVVTETERPENQGCNIRLDPKERKVYRDEVVIDQWRLHHF